MDEKDFLTLPEALINDNNNDKRFKGFVIKNAFFISLYSILWLGIIFGFVYVHAMTHERIHMLIYQDYNVSAHVVYYAPWDSGDAIAATIANREESNTNCNETCNLLHTQNEIIGYNSVLLGVFGIIIAFLFWMTNLDDKANTTP